jgi:hypothetical protein
LYGAYHPFNASGYVNPETNSHEVLVQVTFDTLLAGGKGGEGGGGDCACTTLLCSMKTSQLA